jgi:hypothetical protein
MITRSLPAMPGLPRFIGDAAVRRAALGWALFVVSYGFTLVVVALG